MSRFEMCGACAAEYRDSGDRRFHAQPNACPDCGPQLELRSTDGAPLARRDAALSHAAAAIRAGQIAAVKGLGGFHLMVDARNDQAIQRLRSAKDREEKPFALMAPDLAWVRTACRVSAAEERSLLSPQAPIVLLERLPRSETVAPGVAPRNPYLGVMLPYTPLHHLLLAELRTPLVATSGNRSDEPICTAEHEAPERLRGLADVFLVHDRPIARPIDDSVVRLLDGEELLLRRARGYAPLPVTLDAPLGAVLAVGAQLKATVALSVGCEVFLSQHIGDLETPEAEAAHRRACADLPSLYACAPAIVACDAHPDYASTRLAAGLGRPVIAVQHHHAHVVACMAENGLAGPVLGVSWDGTGLGPDGTVWGGEFLRADARAYSRVAHLRTFRLPGGDAAIREPRRAALGLLHSLFGRGVPANAGVATLAAFSETERRVLLAMIESALNAPLTSSAGRLFDAVASLIGHRQVSRYEGQAAMELEFALFDAREEGRYPFGIDSVGADTPYVLDWGPMVEALLADVAAERPVPFLSARFHNTLVEMIVAVARKVGEEKIVLTGGCFQNRYLTVHTIRRLTAEGFRPFRHRLVPPNDGGLALGQAVIAAARLAEGP
jgi:hydrogenase maturation protein HypF